MKTAPALNLVDRYGPWGVVTGASSGIGRELAAALAREGMHLVLVARREAALDALAEDLRATHGIDARVVPLDLGADDALEMLSDATAELDVELVCLAAGFGSSGPFVERPIARECEMVTVNCRAVLAQCHHFGGRFVARRRGAIVLASSLLAFQGVPGAATYAATKAFVQSLGEALAAELAPAGVDVVAFAPAQVATGFARTADLTMVRAASPARVAAGTLAALGRRVTVAADPRSRLLTLALAPLPRPVRVRILTGVMREMMVAPDAPASRRASH